MVSQYVMALQEDHQEFMSVETPPSDLSSVGALIRGQRETVGLTQEQLSSTLNMGLEQLQALEEGQADKLPEPVFVKAMVRRLANHLRMDADALVAQLGPTPPATSGGRSIFAKAAPSMIAPRSKRGRGPTLLLLPSALLLTGTGVALWQVGLGSDNGPAPQPISQKPSPSQASLPAPKPEPLPVQPKPSLEKKKTEVTINSTQPSWIALRRGGTIFFQGTLKEPRVVDQPEEVEIYAGRPDLVTVVVADGTPRVVGNIDDLRWRRIIPER